MAFLFWDCENHNTKMSVRPILNATKDVSIQFPGKSAVLLYVMSAERKHPTAFGVHLLMSSAAKCDDVWGRPHVECEVLIWLSLLGNSTYQLFRTASFVTQAACQVD